MKYMGSKSKIKKYICPIIQKYIDTNGIETYIEPFVGGANVIDSIKAKNRIGGDNNEYLIEFLKFMQQDGKLPDDDVSRDLYNDVRNNKNTDKYPKWYIGAIGFLASYNGKFFDGGYAQEQILPNGKKRNYYQEGKRNVEKQFSLKTLLDINFIHTDYEFFSNISNSLIYCDIPYENTQQFSTSKNFDYYKFWNWAKLMSKNNIVLVSEVNEPIKYLEPNQYKCIWQQEIIRSQNVNNKFKATEKLFIINAN